MASSKKSAPGAADHPVIFEVETWQQEDLGDRGQVLRCEIHLVVGVDKRQDQLVLADGGRRVNAQMARLVAPKNRSSVAALPNFVERDSIVEVWTHDHHGEEGEDRHCWYLAKVLGFKQREELLVQYLIDGGREWVKKSAARVPNDKEPFLSVHEVLKICPKLSKTNSSGASSVKNRKEEQKVMANPENSSVASDETPGNHNNNTVSAVVELDQGEFRNSGKEAIRKFLAGEEAKIELEITSLSSSYLTKEHDLEATMQAITNTLDQKHQERAELELRMSQVNDECRALLARQFQLDCSRQKEDRIHEYMLRWIRGKKRDLKNQRVDLLGMEEIRGQDGDESGGAAGETCSLCKRTLMMPPFAGSEDGSGGVGEFVFVCSGGHCFCAVCHSQASNCSVCGVRLVWSHPLCLYAPPVPTAAAPPVVNMPPPPPQQQVFMPSIFAHHPPMPALGQHGMRYFMFPPQFQQPQQQQQSH